MDISRQAVIENDRIAQLCDTCGLTQLLFTTQSLAGKKVKVSAFRALIGAIGLESGSDAVDTVMHLLGVTTE